MMNKFVEERFNKIFELNEKISFDDLRYHYKNRKSGTESFHDFDNAVVFLKKDKRSQDSTRKCKKIKVMLNQI